MAAEEELIQPQQEKMARQAENAELRAKLAGVSETLMQGRQQLEALEEQQAKDSHNSHLPPASRKQGMSLLIALEQTLVGHPVFPAF